MNTVYYFHFTVDYFYEGTGPVCNASDQVSYFRFRAVKFTTTSSVCYGRPNKQIDPIDGNIAQMAHTSIIHLYVRKPLSAILIAIVFRFLYFVRRTTVNIFVYKHFKKHVNCHESYDLLYALGVFHFP